MNKPAAIQGTFADFKLIKTRSVCQLIVEVNIEDADAALLALGGLPNPSREVPVAIARLNTAKVIALPKLEQEARPRRDFKDLPAAQQAALKCKDAAFQRFLFEEYSSAAIHEHDAADKVRDICRVESRSELNSNPEAGNRWWLILSAFDVWMREPV